MSFYALTAEEALAKLKSEDKLPKRIVYREHPLNGTIATVTLLVGLVFGFVLGVVVIG